NERIGALLSEMLVHGYRQLRYEMAKLRRGDAHAITYVPISSTRLKERGFNQAEQMALRLGQRIGLPILHALERPQHTSNQSMKTIEGRMEDLQHAFRLNPLLHKQIAALEHRYCTNELNLILLDDVYTAGSTLQQCASLLKQATGASL